MKPEHRNLLIGAAILILALVLSFYILTAVIVILLRLAVIAAAACGIAYLVLPAAKREACAAKIKSIFGR